MAHEIENEPGHDQLPLKGVVLCCTSLPQEERTRAADIACQMGAVHKLDLTSDVTHLVVGSTDTPKYRYTAKERPDIHVLSPAWIDALRASWMAGEDVDVARLQHDHRLPPFAGLEICVTGFADPLERASLASTVRDRGASYHDNLTKAVTHLIAAAPSGAKYTHAKQWGIKIVSLRWLEDGLARGMALDESLYDPVLPLEEQGRGAFRDVPRPRMGGAGKRRREEGAGGDADGGDEGKRKLRRSASSRLDSHSQDVWQDLSSREVSFMKGESDKWADEGGRANNTGYRADVGGVAEPSAAGDGASRQPANAVPRGLFSDCHVFICAFEKTKAARLQQFLEPNGATVERSALELESAGRGKSYILVPHAQSREPITLPDVPAGTITVTEWWVERCIFYKTLLDPAEDPLSRPLWSAGVEGFSDFSISTTGFSGVDVRQMAEAVTLMGGSYQEKVLPETSALISASSSIKKEKAFYARKHNIPVVTVRWLWACLSEKTVAPFAEFKVELPRFDPREFGADSTSASHSRDGDAKAGREANGGESSHQRRAPNNPKKHVTRRPSLKPEKPEPSVGKTKSGPFVLDDDDNDNDTDNDNGIDQGRAPAEEGTRAGSKRSKDHSALASTRPLKEISPNPSPRKSHSQHTTLKPSHPRAEATPVSAEPLPPAPQLPPPQTHQHLTASLADLLSKSAASRPAPNSPARRKHRPLGRNLSAASSRSASASASAQCDGPDDPDAHANPSPSAFDLDLDPPPAPGTQLGYDAPPEAEAQRRQMSEKTGVKLQLENSTGRRLAAGPIGVVKDSEFVVNAGVKNRTRARGKRGG